jgi:hypothetical protein
MGLCAYKNVFGAPREGVHAHRTFGLATVDLIMTVIGGMLLNYLILGATVYGYVVAPLMLWLVGTFLHTVFCVDTPITRKLKRM